MYLDIFTFSGSIEGEILFSFHFERKINKVLEFNAIRFPCFETSPTPKGVEIK